MSTLKKRLEAYENVSIISGATVTKILAERTIWQGEPGIAGVEYEADAVPAGFDDSDVEGEKEKKLVTIFADAIVLATGEKTKQWESDGRRGRGGEGGTDTRQWLYLPYDRCSALSKC